MRLEGHRDRSGRDAEVPRGEREQAGDVEGRDDHHRGGERLVDAECGADRRGGGQAAPRGQGEPGREADGSARLPPECPEGVEEVGGAAPGLAVAGLTRDSDGCGDEPERDQQRPQRDDARGRPATTSAPSTTARAAPSAAKSAAGRPEPGLGRKHAGEEPDPHHVAGAGGHEGVDERPGTVAGAGVGDGDAPAAEPDRAAPGAGGRDDRDRETEAGEPEPFRVGGPDGVECRRDPRAEELRRRDRCKEDEEEEAAAAIPRRPTGR